MTAQGLETLDKVIELAERKRDEALAALSAARREHQAAQEQMDQLTAYAAEAQQRWQARCASGVDAAWLMHHRQFMAKVEHAMDFQTGVLGQKQRQIDQVQQQVHEAERELATLRQYVARQQEAIQQRLMRREQKQTDEMALNAHRRRAESDSTFQSFSA
ncbi:flagellar export protein FliJ [Hydrogenophaga sp. YM1]|jgi:flagellar FliJ protein|uniref:flagellar export protein FliJ n=2 Tax=Comamonadaceae TaxID=80864 RepID=UPI00086B1816|nr:MULTISPECIES: flagellar export protein FliJ [unclassified Hydrogenophaga]MBN9373443.1 flagellar export protein FliJ [Hydrogenophaga sp.]ODT29667.1 MAG: flagellar export protein FliJ [Hydrogenophaga sp. SCN 70-13]QRR35086.1 flagellar export protein FliJ [Hydrogenophaga sp. YM1]